MAVRALREKFAARRVIGALFVCGLVLACQKRDTLLPGQSDVPGPDEPQAAQPCKAVSSDGSTLLASKLAGWGILLPGDAWELECPDVDHASGKMTSNRGESLILSITRVDQAPLSEKKHLDIIYQRARATLPKAGAKPGEPEHVVGRATPSSPQKTVLVYQVFAPQFEKDNVRNFHGWSVVRTEEGGIYECHLSATIRKDLDWAQVLGKHLSSCLPLAK